MAQTETAEAVAGGWLRELKAGDKVIVQIARHQKLSREARQSASWNALQVRCETGAVDGVETPVNLREAWRYAQQCLAALQEAMSHEAAAKALTEIKGG